MSVKLQRGKAAKRAFPLTGVLFVVLVAFLAIVPPTIGGFLPHSLATYMIYGLFALAVALIAGFGRLFNIGVGATFGVGSYAPVLLNVHGVNNPFVLFLCAMVCGLLVSALFGVYSALASGLEYMMLTFLTSLAFASVPAAFQTFTGGENGLSAKNAADINFGLHPLQGNEYYWFVLGVVTVCGLLSWYVLTSEAGRASIAMGRNPVRASAMGYDVNRYRMALTLFSGLMATIAGWLYALQTAFVFPDLLGLPNSLNGLVYALVGGAESIIGPFLGAAGLRYVSEVFSQHSTQSSIYIGIVLLLVVYFVPDGIAGLWNNLLARLRRTPLGPGLEDTPPAPVMRPEESSSL